VNVKVWYTSHLSVTEVAFNKLSNNSHCVFTCFGSVSSSESMGGDVGIGVRLLLAIN